VADRLTPAVHSGDVLGRLGGDEFAVVAVADPATTAAAEDLGHRALGDAAPSGARFGAVGLATVPLTLGAATVALWAALHV